MRFAWLLLALTLPGLAGAFAPGAYLAPRLSSRGTAVRSPLHALRCNELSGTSPSTRRALLQGIAVTPLAALATRPVAAAPAAETVLVVGARSYVGEYVVEELQRQGKRVRCLTRNPGAAEELNTPGIFSGVYNGVEWMVGDLNRPATITADVVKGASHIIFCPGAHGWANPESNRLIYDEGVSLLLSLGKGGGLKHFVYLSSIGVSQKVPDTDEYSYLRQVYKYKRRGEAALRRSGTPYTIIRAPGTYDREMVPGFSYSRDEIKGELPGEADILVTGEDSVTPNKLFLGHLATVVVDSAFSDAAAGKSFNLATRQKDAPRGQPWKDAVHTLVRDAERKIPWPQDYP